MKPNPFAPFVGPFSVDDGGMGERILDANGKAIARALSASAYRGWMGSTAIQICSLLNAEWERVQKENSAKRADEIANRRLNQIFGEKENQKEENV